ncbi:MAG: Flp pilus assembly protein CpaB [Phenylobacterium sp.]|nr:Flp pilus assembly protein CpaB [Phenylobacterium sp.]
MRVVTIVSLGASAVLGLAALFVAKAVLPHAGQTNSLAAGMQQPVAGVPVVVAKSDLKFGDRLDAGKLSILHVPANAVPAGAFTTVEQVLAQDHGGPPVALGPIAARELLLPARLSGPGARASVAVEIADGYRAYTIKVSDATGVGGHALPGDRVDVVVMRDLTPEGDTRNYVSEVVLQNVRVLAVDLNLDLVANKPAQPSTATLEVKVEDTQKLAVAGDLGKLSLALRKTGAAEFVPTAPMRTGNFMIARSPAPARAGPGSGSGLASAPSYSGPIIIVEGGPHGRGAKPAAAPPPPPPPPPPAPGPSFALVPLNTAQPEPAA